MIACLQQFSAGRRFLRHPRARREDLVAYQDARLRRLVAHAYERVPYYRQLLDRQGLKPAHIRRVKDLGLIPITSRSEMQELPVEQIVASGFDPESLILRKTSGSSGKPMVVRRTWMEERLHGILALRALRSYGLKMSDRHCYVMSPRGVHHRDYQAIQRVLQFLGVGRHDQVVSCFQSPEEIVQVLERLRPHAISGFPVVLARVARVVNHNRLRALQFHFIGTGGEVLTPLMRQQIEEGFHAPVRDTYGSHEFHLLAWQCGSTGDLHVCDDGMILEVVQGARSVDPGESGEVVGTNLHSFAMPLIRYRLGDVVTKGSDQCRCGQPFSTIRHIQGRMRDYFLLPDGQMIHPYEVAFAAGVERELAPWIKEFQMTQERVDRIVMRVVPRYEPASRDLAAVSERTARVLGLSVQFHVELVSEIPSEANGKFRLYRSLVQSPYDQVRQ